VLSEVAENIHEKISMLIYVTAFLLPDGATLVGVVPLESLKELIIPVAPGGFIFPPDKLQKHFYNTTSKELFDIAASNMKPDPFAVISTPVHVTSNFHKVPRAYIECVQDKAIDIALQRSMCTILPCSPVVTMDCDHSPFFSAPQELVDNLLKIVQTL